MSDDCSGDVGGCDSGGFSNDYSCDTQTSNCSLNNDYCSDAQTDNNQTATLQVGNDYSDIGSTFSALDDATEVVNNVEYAKSATDNLDTATRLQIDTDPSIDNQTEKSETITWNNLTSDSIPFRDRYVTESNYLYESSLVSTNNAISNANNKNSYNRPRIEISENSTQSNWFCIIMVALATFLILLMIACVVLANIPTGSATERTTIYSPVMSRPLPQGARNPISKI